MFKQNIKKKEQKQINEVQKKKTKQKKLWSVRSCWKEWDVRREEKMRKCFQSQNANLSMTGHLCTFNPSIHVKTSPYRITS